MNGSQAAELGAVPKPDNGEPDIRSLLRWAQIKKELRAARRAVLEAHDLNEDSLKRLEEAAFLEFADTGQEEVQTSDGICYYAYHPMFLHKNSQEFGGTRRLHWRETNKRD